MRTCFCVAFAALTAGILSACAVHAPVPPVADDRRQGACSPGEPCNNGWLVLLPIPGRFLADTGDGARRPARSLEVYAATYIDGRRVGELRRVKAAVKRNGEVSFPACVDYAERDVCTDEGWRQVQYFHENHYLIRARGCRDKDLVVTKGWKPTTVVLECSK
jgi:hypothetical protein